MTKLTLHRPSVLGIIILAIAAGLPAEGSYREGKGGKGRAFLKCFKETYQPTDEQMKQVKEIHRSAQIKGKRKAAFEAKDQLQEMMRSDAKPERLRSQFDKVQTLMRDFKKERFEKALAIRGILTPEQRERLGECGWKRKERRRHKTD